MTTYVGTICPWVSEDNKSASCRDPDFLLHPQSEVNLPEVVLKGKRAFALLSPSCPPRKPREEKELEELLLLLLVLLVLSAPVLADNLPIPSRAAAALLIASGDAKNSGFCTFAAFTTTSLANWKSKYLHILSLLYAVLSNSKNFK